MATPDDIRATIDQYAERMTAGNKDAWLELFADDATLEDPVGSGVKHGKEEIAAFWDFVRTLSAEMELRRTGPVRLAGIEAAFPFEVITPVGDAKYSVPIIDVMTFDDDARITSMRAFWDPADMSPIE